MAKAQEGAAAQGPDKSNSSAVPQDKDGNPLAVGARVKVLTSTRCIAATGVVKLMDPADVLMPDCDEAAKVSRIAAAESIVTMARLSTSKWHC